MSDLFPPVYRHRLQGRGRHEKNVFVCCEGMAHTDGEGTLTFWVEIDHPAWVEKEDGHHLRVEERTERVYGSATVYSYELITRRKESGTEFVKSNEKFMQREIVIALARGEVSGRSRGTMMWHVFWDLVGKGGPKWLTESAPDWWKLMDPNKKKAVS